MGNKVSAFFKTALNLSPERSQIILVFYALICAFCLVTGFFFLWYRPELAFVPLIFAILSGVALLIGANRSQQFIDMRGGEPTVMKAPNGIHISTDSRALFSSEACKGLGTLFSQMGNMQPLPTPDGMVNGKVELIPNSQAEAAQRVNEINQRLGAARSGTVEERSSISEREKSFRQLGPPENSELASKNRKGK